MQSNRQDVVDAIATMVTALTMQDLSVLATSLGTLNTAMNGYATTCVLIPRAVVTKAARGGGAEGS
jgi:hypothetical protein